MESEKPMPDNVSERLEAVQKELRPLAERCKSQYVAAILHNLEEAVRQYPEANQMPSGFHESVSMSVLAAGAAVELEIVNLHIHVSLFLDAFGMGEGLEGPSLALVGQIPNVFGAKHPPRVYRLGKRIFDKTFRKGDQYERFAELIKSAETLTKVLGADPPWLSEQARSLKNLRNKYAHEVAKPNRVTASQGENGKSRITTVSMFYWGSTPDKLQDDAFCAANWAAQCIKTICSALDHLRENGFELIDRVIDQICLG